MGHDNLATITWRYKFVLVAMVVISLAVSLGATYALQRDEWEASVLMRVGRPSAFANEYTDSAYLERLLQTVRTITSDKSVAEAAGKAMGLPPESVRGLPNKVHVSVQADTELLRFAVRDTDAKSAQDLLGPVLTEAGSRVKTVYGDSVSFTAVEPIDQPAEKVSTNIPLVAVASSMGALLIGIGFAFAHSARSRTS
jgi:capsular polysaccharide biosynthesis protein